jgi:hypothetical protein
MEYIQYALHQSAAAGTANVTTSPNVQADPSTRVDPVIRELERRHSKHAALKI